jgi:hypothetical protein
VRVATIGLIVVAALPALAHAQTPCAGGATSGVRFFIEPIPAAARDSVPSARLCLAPGPKGIGSYMADVMYDSTRMRAVRVETTGGMQVANSRAAGIIRIAGASPAGFAKGQLAILRFKLAGGKTLGQLTLTVREASTPAGASVLSETRMTGWPVERGAAPKSPPPHIDSVSPRSAEVDAEGVTNLVLYGRGFAASGNTVVFDAAQVTGLRSEAGGTIIRFSAPTFIPAQGAKPGHRVTPGPVQVRVKHAGGTSNAMIFTAREEGE